MSGETLFVEQKTRPFEVYYSKEYNTINKVCVTDMFHIINFRTADKGLGAASMLLRRRSRKTKDDATLNNTSEEKSNNKDYTDYSYVPQSGDFIFIYSRVKNGKYIENFSPDDVSQMIWSGYINEINREIIKTRVDLNETTEDAVGLVNCNEIGHWIYNINFSEFGTNMGKIGDCPGFNPSYEEYIIGNHYQDGDFSLIKKNNFKKIHKNSIVSAADLEFFWNRERLITFMFQTQSAWVNLVPIIRDTNKEYWQFPEGVVKASDILQFESIQNKTLGQVLDEIIKPPYSWAILPPTSENYLEVTFYSESKETLLNIAKNEKQYALTEVDNIVSVSKLEIEPSVDRVVYKGDNILFCGSICPFDWNKGANALDRDWTNNDEKLWVGTDDAEANAAMRQEKFPKVYCGYKYVQDNEDDFDIKLSKLPGEYINDATKTSFFPKIEFTMVGNNVIDGITYFDGSVYGWGKINTGAKQSPSPATMKVASFLPFTNDGYWGAVDGESLAISGAEFAKPMALYPFYLNSKLFHLDVLSPAHGEQCKLEFNDVGLVVKTKYPEIFGWNNAELFAVSGSPYYGYTTATYLKEANCSVDKTLKNPNTGQTTLGTHWQGAIFTIAVYSDQRLERTITKPGVTIPKNTKVFEDRDFKAWYIHPNTVVGLKIDEYTLDNRPRLQRLYKENEKIKVYDTKPEGYWSRYDYPKLHARAEAYAKWLFTNRGSYKIEYSADYNGSFVEKKKEVNPDTQQVTTKEIQHDPIRIGTLIKTITYNGKPLDVNTCIKSIEYLGLDTKSPRLVVQTAIPDVPIFREVKEKVNYGIEQIAYASSNSSLGVATKESEKIEVRADEKGNVSFPSQPSFGEISTRGGGEVADIPVYIVIGGNMALDFDDNMVYGYNFVKTMPGSTMTNVNISGGPSEYVGEIGSYNFTDGFGICRQVGEEEQYFYLANVSREFNYELVAGDRFVSTTTMSISGQGGYRGTALVPEVLL